MLTQVAEFVGLLSVPESITGNDPERYFFCPALRNTPLVFLRICITIPAPFTFDGAGALCWQTSNLGSYINARNLASLTINGVDFTHRWAAPRQSTHPAGRYCLARQPCPGV